eukprot:PhM_4_TR6269/c0_g1_i2/m.83069
MNVRELVRENEELHELLRHSREETRRLKREMHDLNTKVSAVETCLRERQQQQQQDEDEDEDAVGSRESARYLQAKQDLRRLAKSGATEIAALRSRISDDDDALTRLSVCVFALQKKFNVPHGLARRRNKYCEDNNNNDRYNGAVAAVPATSLTATTERQQSLLAQLVDELHLTVTHL